MTHRLKLVRLREPKAIRRNMPSAQVNGNARPGNWPGVFISLCWQRVTAFPPPTPAISIPQVRFWGPKATMMVAPVARKNVRELSDSLVNRLKRFNSRVAFGTSSVFELVAGRARSSRPDAVEVDGSGAAVDHEVMRTARRERHQSVTGRGFDSRRLHSTSLRDSSPSRSRPIVK